MSAGRVAGQRPDRAVGRGAYATARAARPALQPACSIRPAQSAASARARRPPARLRCPRPCPCPRLPRAASTAPRALIVTAERVGRRPDRHPYARPSADAAKPTRTNAGLAPPPRPSSAGTGSSPRQRPAQQGAGKVIEPSRPSSTISLGAVSQRRAGRLDPHQSGFGFEMAHVQAGLDQRLSGLAKAALGMTHRRLDRRQQGKRLGLRRAAGARLAARVNSACGCAKRNFGGGINVSRTKRSSNVGWGTRTRT